MTPGSLAKVVAVVPGPVPTTVPEVPGLLAWSVHLPHPEAPSPHPSEVGGVVMAWIAPGHPLEPAAWLPGPVTAYRVDEHVVVPWPRPVPDGTPTPGIEQCSVVRRLPSLRRTEFAEHWRRVHAPLVPVHHPGVVRYVQNVVIEPLTPDAPEVDGIAQLSFATVHDFHERYYDSDAGRAAVGADVARFIDRPRGWRIHAQETWLRS